MIRGLVTGVLGFFAAGLLCAAVLGRVLPGDWSPDAFAVTGLLAAVLAGAAGGAAGAWQGTPLAGIGGALIGALLLVASQPQLDLITAVSVLAVLAGGTAGALVLSRG